MKRILKMILTGILLFCTAFSVVGCGEENGMTEEERIAYENIEKYHLVMMSGDNYDIREEYRVTHKQELDSSSATENRKVNIITNKEGLDEAFSSFIEVDFETEMVIVYFFVKAAYNTTTYLSGLTIDEENNVTIKLNEYTPRDEKGEILIGGTPPQMYCKVFKMDKVETISVDVVHKWIR